MAPGMDAAVKRAEADDDVRVVILTSSNDKVFCAGADLKERQGMHSQAEVTARRELLDPKHRHLRAVS